MGKNLKEIPSKTLGLFKNIASYFAPPPQLTVSEWADKYRVLRSATSAEPGSWSTDRVPYMREIMDCLAETSPVQSVCFMKSAQIAGSESGNNWIGYIIHQAPAPAMMVQPTTDIAKKYSQQRVAPMIADCPALAERIPTSKSREQGNTVLLKEFPGGILVLSGANSAAGLRSMPIKNLFLDEVDAYPDDVEGEGDPVDLAMARTRTFSNRKVFKCSTPTIRGFSRIEQDYLESDQRRYFVPCPHCEHMHVLNFRTHFIIPKDEQGNKLPKDAHMVCPECGCKIEEASKPYMLENGEWRVTCPENDNPKRRGYHISTLYSPLGWFSWGEIAELWIKAQQDTTRLKAFVNTILGETWAEDGEQLDHETIYENNRVVYEADLPSEVLVITASVDVQDDRLEYEFKGWAVGRQSYGLEYGVLMGDPAQDAVWNQLDQHLQRTFAYADGYKLPIMATCIDSGGHFTDKVYKFCKDREHRRVFAIKGRGGAGLPIILRPTRNNRIGAALFAVGVDTAKDLVYARLRERDRSKDGYCYFPMNEDGSPTKGYDLRYFRGLTSEKRMIRYVKGHAKFEWYKTSGARNEPLDLTNYAIAALEILNPNFEVLAKQARRVNLTQEKPMTGAPVQRNKRRIISKGIA